MYRVMIVEDDAMVADINKKYLEKSPAFHVQVVFKNGVDALAYLKKSHHIDLILLDYYMPLMNGGTFLERIQSLPNVPAVIMVTSANDVALVRQLMARGVVDYLVKPFEYGRFHQALDRFRQHHHLLMACQGAELNQAEIDRLLTVSEPPADSPPPIAKGLNSATLHRIRDVLRDNAGQLFTSEQLAERVGLSRITIRRYVNYMVEMGELVSSIDYQTGGRPCVMYSYPKG